MVSAELIDCALAAADAARRETLARSCAAFIVENKAAAGPYDPVTDADREAERAMRDIIAKAFPDHAISGEELGEATGIGPFSWSLDPIDGTRSYTNGLPTWTTLIGLLEEGDPVLGVIDAPRLDERYVGSSAGSWLTSPEGRAQLRASGCTLLHEARLATTDPFLFEADDSSGFANLYGTARTTRFGHDAYAYARLAAGSIDLVVEAGLKPHDYHALIPVVRGAGGVFGDWHGGSDFSAGKVIAAATPQLYRAAVEIMRSA